MGNETYSTISSYVEIQAVNLKGGPTENKKCMKLESQNKNYFISSAITYRKRRINY